jgi:LytS/YehU family sensor histidine kinase
MNEDTGIFFLILALIVAIVWLAVKLNKANVRNQELDYANSSLSDQNDKLHKENSKLIADNAMLEAEQLKFQLQPHTLGNVVSTINAIAKNLHRGTESLAESLNYILYKGNSHLVSVEDEINFIKKYIQLNQLLYSDIISTSLDDTQVQKASSYYSAPCIPHLISAYLIENAYKHGDKSHHDFMKVVLKLSNQSFEILVVNRLLAQPTMNKVGGLGIKNMEKRLELLLNDRFEVKRSCNENEYITHLIIRF